MNRDLSHNLLARAAIAVVVTGFFVFVIGLFPALINLNFTPGIGLLKITTFLFGIALMTLGAYLYVYATRQRDQEGRLRDRVGPRLMASGLVLAYTAGYADVLGIGSEARGQPLVFGPVQAIGVTLGVFVIVAGLLIYAW